MPTKPKPSAKNESGDFDKFSDFVRRLVAVPNSEVKASMEAEKKQKKSSSASPAPDADPRDS